jgi:ATP-binding cassette subfamily D (ALD) protein 3
MKFKKIINLDNRINHPDQIFTNDVEKWSNSLSELFLSLLKPVLDLVLLTRKLSTTIGYKGPFLMMGWFLLSGVLMKYMSPSFGKLVAIEQSLEGNFRACHSNMIQYSEEIAFYKGNEWEENRLNNSFEVKFFKKFRNCLNI